MLELILKNINFTQRWTIIFLVWLLNIPTTIFPFSKSTDYSEYGYYFDFLTFRAGDTNNTLLEILTQFPTQNFKFVKFTEGYYAHYEISLRLLNENDTLVEWKHQIDTIKVNISDNISNLNPRVIHASFIVPPGKYQAELYLIDLETHAVLTLVKNIVAPDYGHSGLKLSDMQLSTSINYSEEKSVLVKNNWKILPNIPRLFGLEFNTLYVYVEIYNLNFKIGKLKKEFTATYTISNNKKEKVKSIELSNEIPGEIFVLVAKIPIQELDSGQYQLTLNVRELDSGQVIEKSTYFNIIKSI